MFIYDQQGAVALGREEGWEQAQRSIAQKLLTLLDDEAIAATTGLSMETVRELRQKMS